MGIGDCCVYMLFFNEMNNIYIYIYFVTNYLYFVKIFVQVCASACPYIYK